MAHPPIRVPATPPEITAVDAIFQCILVFPSSLGAFPSLAVPTRSAVPGRVSSGSSDPARTRHGHVLGPRSNAPIKPNNNAAAAREKKTHIRGSTSSHSTSRRLRESLVFGYARTCLDRPAKQHLLRRLGLVLVHIHPIPSILDTNNYLSFQYIAVKNKISLTVYYAFVIRWMDDNILGILKALSFGRASLMVLLLRLL